MSSELLDCTYGGSCAGCPLIKTPYSEQKKIKLESLKQLWEASLLAKFPEVRWVNVGLGGLRDRADITWHQTDQPALGLYDLANEKILDIKSCAQMSKKLAEFFQDIRQVHFPVSLGSLRLRVGPEGQRGIWLDFSNLSVKELFEERKTLLKLLELAHVEVGQRRKVLKVEQGDLKLKDPEPRPWFQTYMGAEERPTPIVCSIADFTQPSMEANRHLVREALAPVRKHRLKRAAEFGSGSGNFTLPLAEAGEELFAFEREPRARENLQLNLTNHNLQSKVHFPTGDVPGGLDYVFVDPPRPGLQKFLDPFEGMSAIERPKHFIYVSCFAESFVQDVGRLEKMGYRTNTLSVVDQFPQSRHFEIVAHLVQA